MSIAPKIGLGSARVERSLKNFERLGDLLLKHSSLKEPSGICGEQHSTGRCSEHRRNE